MTWNRRRADPGLRRARGPPLCGPAGSAGPAVGRQPAADRQAAHAPAGRALGRRYGPYFRFTLGRRKCSSSPTTRRSAAICATGPTASPDPATGADRQRDRPARRRLRRRGRAWRRQRRMVMAGFDPRHLRAYFPSLVQGLRSASSGAGSGAADAGTAHRPAGRPDALHGRRDRRAWRSASDVNTLESDDDVIQRHLDKIFPALFRRMLAPVPTWRWWKSPPTASSTRSVRRGRSAAIDGFIARRARASPHDPERRAAPAQPARGDDRRRRRCRQRGSPTARSPATCMTMLLAGEDTTANTLAWVIWLPARASGGAGAARAPRSTRVAGTPTRAATPERHRRAATTSRPAPTRRCG